MSDFGFYYSGKDNSAAVEDLLSQAEDLYVLEQVAAINCSAFTDSSSLPTNLESRFRRLKSLPVSSSNKLLSHSKTMSSAFSGHEKRNPSDKYGVFSPTTEKLLAKEKLRISSSSFTSIDLSSPKSELNQEKSKPKSKFSISWLGKLASPSQALGCLFPSPSKETKKKKSKSSEELLAAEEQKRKTKIAMKESKRRQREVDRVIRKSRQAIRSYV